MSGLNFRVSKRYARALLSLSQENGILERAYEDMKLLSSTLTSSKELQALLKSPVIREGKKQRVLKALFAEHLHPLIMTYIQIIVRKQRAALLIGISRSFLVIYKEAKGIELVRLTTAVPVDETIREKAMQVARNLTELSIEFVEKVDPSIIGGFILNLGDRQFDASIRSRLTSMRKQLNI
jgi:F-type H+-transporting ATPase subunit delta